MNNESIPSNEHQNLENEFLQDLSLREQKVRLEEKRENRKGPKFLRFEDSEILNFGKKMGKDIWQKVDGHLDGNNIGNKLAYLIVIAKGKYQAAETKYKKEERKNYELQTKFMDEFRKKRSVEKANKQERPNPNQEKMNILLAFLMGALATGIGLTLNGDIKGVKGLPELFNDKNPISTQTESLTAPSLENTIKDAERNDETVIGNKLKDMAVKFETELPSELLSFEQVIREAGARGEISPSNPDSVAMFLKKEFLSDVTIMGEEDVRKYIISINFLERKGFLSTGITEQTAYSGLGQLQELLERIKNEENVNPRNVFRLKNNIIFLKGFLGQNSTLPNTGIYNPQVEPRNMPRVSIPQTPQPPAPQGSPEFSGKVVVPKDIENSATN